MPDKNHDDHEIKWEHVNPTSLAHAYSIRAKLDEEKLSKEILSHESGYYEHAIIKTTEKLYSLKRKLIDDQKAVDQCSQDLEKLLGEKKFYESHYGTRNN